MDIKLKKFSNNRLIRTMAFWLCVVMFLGALAGGGFLFGKARTTNYGNGVDDLLLYDNYESSAVFQREFSNKLDQVVSLLANYKSEAYIKAGNTVDEDRMQDALREYFYNGDGNYGRSYRVRGNNGEFTISAVSGIPYEQYGGEFDDPAVLKRFLSDYADQISKLRETMIEDDLRAFQALEQQLDAENGFFYYATDGDDAVSNLESAEIPVLASSVTEAAVKTGTTTEAKRKAAEKNTALLETFRKAPAYLIYQNDGLEKLPASGELSNASYRDYDQSLEDNLDGYYNDNLIVALSFDQSYLAEKSKEFSEVKAEVVRWIPLTGTCALLSLILLIFLIVTTGRKDEEGNWIPEKTDRIFTELQLAIILGMFFGGGLVFVNFLLESVSYGVSYQGILYNINEPLYLSVAIAALAGLFSAGVGLHFILSVVRNLKAQRFLKNSMVVMVASALWSGLRDFYHGGSVMRKVVFLTLAICFLSATIVLAPVMAVIVLVFAPKWVKKYEAVKKGVEEVKNGNLSYKIAVDGDGELEQLAKGINQISLASSLAIQSELKNQRLKTDLISNVSHDLKTPLTSIITYIDLLKKEGLDSPDAAKYLEILDQKSIRLKKLTEDLFDAAKASSGAIPVRFERVDLLSLINQGLGEMGDRIEMANLEFRINARKDRYYVKADGQLLWRVVENLLNNVLKYAQEDSRVYIDITEQNGMHGNTPRIMLEIKNISRTELNIDADELMERFKRGDESRTTEGSGLGLAIAKDLVRLQNGLFEIKIDGDLFKAIVILEENREEKGGEQPEQESE